jgi:hypothetical protein
VPTLPGAKNSQSVHLPGPHSGQLSTLTPGDTLARSQGHYGKGGPQASALKQIRGGMGGMKRIRGGLGPGRMGQPGTSKDYSMTDTDLE